VVGIGGNFDENIVGDNPGVEVFLFVTIIQRLK